MTINVEQSWIRIENWLQSQAPRSYGGLRTTADPEAIATAEQTFGVTFPADLTASGTTGQGPVPIPGMRSSSRTATHSSC
jgi:cell wall assembly regulator SMI1